MVRIIFNMLNDWDTCEELELQGIVFTLHNKKMLFHRVEFFFAIIVVMK